MSASDNAASLALWERIFGELVACYGEGESTDWPYLTDLASVIVSIVERERTQDNPPSQGTP